MVDGQAVDELKNRLAELNRKLAAREGKPEYKQNITFIRDEIARVEALIAAG